MHKDRFGGKRYPRSAQILAFFDRWPSVVPYRGRAFYAFLCVPVIDLVECDSAAGFHFGGTKKLAIFPILIASAGPCEYYQTALFPYLSGAGFLFSGNSLARFQVFVSARATPDRASVPQNAARNTSSDVRS